MPGTLEVAQSAIKDALASEYPDHSGADPLVRPSAFADAQSNVALSLAGKIGATPKAIAQTLVDRLSPRPEFDSITVSGPGYINFVASDEWISQQCAQLHREREIITTSQKPMRFVLDYSSPNVAKEMHVGHLRTTIVGDCLARILESKGHSVIRQNHIGDWGTPFGMLLEYVDEIGRQNSAELLTSDANAFYQAARKRFDNDAQFTARARERVVRLQSGDEPTLEAWRWLVSTSKRYFAEIYSALDVSLQESDIAGESSYNPDLADVCRELAEAGLAVESEGALCVFPEGFTNRDGSPSPLIVRKSDGGYGYATTDLSAIRRRVTTLKADVILYVVGAAQRTHFQMVFAVARMAGWLPDSVVAEHVEIGNVLGNDGKILRTRSGSSPKLADLVSEAIERAYELMSATAQELGPPTTHEIAHAVGVGALKFADLAVSHDAEYTFDFDRMISLSEAAGPYVQYAATRAQALVRRADTIRISAGSTPKVQQPDARELAIALLEFNSVINATIDARAPHKLAKYLIDVSAIFNRFYANNRIFSESEHTTQANLGLTELALKVLSEGLALLGIKVPPAM